MLFNDITAKSTDLKVLIIFAYKNSFLYIYTYTFIEFDIYILMVFTLWKLLVFLLARRRANLVYAVTTIIRLDNKKKLV